MSFNVSPTIRKDKINSKGLVPICIVIYHAGIKTKISIGHSIYPEDWDFQRKRVKKSAKLSSLINSLIDKQIADIKKKILAEQIISEKTEINVVSIIRNEKVKDAPFQEFAQKQIMQKNYAEETRRAYKVYLQKISAFKPSLRLREITFSFLQAYEAYLRDELKNSNNTIWGNFKFINTMTNDALKMGYLLEDPFKKFKRISYKQTDRVFLNANELIKVEQFISSTSDNGLALVGNYFLFMAYTGLRFSDAIRFREDTHIVDNERIVLVTQKTKKTANIFINDKIQELIPYIGNNRLEITQVDFNRKLKIIAAGAGVNKKISSHVARHSFGSSLADMGISMEVAKGLLTHGSMSSTKIYYHLKTQNLDDAMKKFNKNK